MNRVEKSGRAASRIKKGKPLATPRTGAEEPPAKPDRRTVWGRLVICREATKLSQADAAKAIGIRAQSLSNLERGKSRKPAADTLLDMRDKVGYDPDYVIRGRGMPLIPNFEELAKEMALIAIFRELRPDVRDTLFKTAQGFRRAQSNGPSAQDPYPEDPPSADD